VLELAAALDLTVAGPLAEQLNKFVGEDLTLDASKVQRLGASCLQVLLSAARTWSVEGASLTLDRPSPRFLEDLRLLGFDPITFLDGATPQ
jgi:chemotaxis protein CheX